MVIPPVDAGDEAEVVVGLEVVVVAEADGFGLALLDDGVGLLLAVLPPVTVMVAFMFGWSAQ
jgi:hypothetical protein